MTSRCLVSFGFSLLLVSAVWAAPAPSAASTDKPAASAPAPVLLPPSIEVNATNQVGPHAPGTLPARPTNVMELPPIQGQKADRLSGKGMNYQFGGYGNSAGPGRAWPSASGPGATGSGGFGSGMPSGIPFR